MTRLFVSVLLLLLPLLVAGQDDESALLERLEQIENWSPAAGTWEGVYSLEAVPEELFQVMDTDGSDTSEIGIRLTFVDDEANVHIKWESDAEWSKIGTESFLIPDSIGSHILLTAEGGVWHERWFVSFIRVEEETAEIVITRTVHNWHNPKGSDVPTTYYVFGAGQVTRIERTQ